MSENNDILEFMIQCLLKNKIENDLKDNWIVISEAIQTILRREGYPNPYEALKGLTRTNSVINSNSISKLNSTKNPPQKFKQLQLSQLPNRTTRQISSNHLRPTNNFISRQKNHRSLP